MPNKIKNLSNKEEWIVLDLKNMKHQVKILLIEITKKENLEGQLSDKLSWYKKVFTYYQDQLLPALQESAEMEKKHMAIVKNNPDPSLNILTSEVEYHQSLYNQFAQRFEEIYHEYHTDKKD
jgi:hypothetical protein